MSAAMIGKPGLAVKLPTPGGIIWGRVRRIGTGGDVGGWRDPAQEAGELIAAGKMQSRREKTPARFFLRACLRVRIDRPPNSVASAKCVDAPPNQRPSVSKVRTDPRTDPEFPPRGADGASISGRPMRAR